MLDVLLIMALVIVAFGGSTRGLLDAKKTLVSHKISGFAAA